MRYEADYATPKGWIDLPCKPILADRLTYESAFVLPPRRKPPIQCAGERAAWRFVEFFTANIRARNTRAAS